ncbi:MAG: histidinol-phosphate transaminase [bacterium]
MSNLSPRPEIEGMSPYEPGKPVEEITREYNLEQDPVKLASNENPYSPPDELRAVFQDEYSRLNRYPDGGSYYLRKALAEKYDWPAQGIVIGAGSDEIVDFLAKAFLRPEDEVVVADPSFIRHQMLTVMMGATPVTVPLTDDYRMNLDRMLEVVTDRTRFICIPNPNNPTSRHVGSEALDEFLTSLPETVTVLLDEAYREFMDQPDYPDGRSILSRYDSTGPSVVLLRTFSKAYGFAGLRVGYGLMEPERATELHKVRPPFNVSRPAQAVAVEALQNDKYVKTARRKISESRSHLLQELRDRGLEVVPPSANFMLVGTPEGFDAESFCEALIKRGVIVRSMAPYGLTEHVRISVGKPEENNRLLTALDSTLG